MGQTHAHVPRIRSLLTEVSNQREHSASKGKRHKRADLTISYNLLLKCFEPTQNLSKCVCSSASDLQTLVKTWRLYAAVIIYSMSISFHFRNFPAFASAMLCTSGKRGCSLKDLKGWDSFANSQTFLQQFSHQFSQEKLNPKDVASALRRKTPQPSISCVYLHGFSDLHFSHAISDALQCGLVRLCESLVSCQYSSRS